ncbi:MAG: type II toxin-antitoxin system PemK/MazF family toxin [Nanoarchaeota archaeon]|nr:type II toxin-antitoxin system PemK/MazF family toxin [Nanoarchaeota archaeon]MBU1103130.1 type II toxin-antitoxin system PemK/MazF family toxin [Nanoarchaeota archaeon]
MRFKKFDIVLVDFPFSDLSETKKRPALIIKSLEGENNILCQITTKRRKFQKYEVILPKISCIGDVRFDSFIYFDMVFTLHQSLIKSKIGEVSALLSKDEINKKLKEIFCG